MNSNKIMANQQNKVRLKLLDEDYEFLEQEATSKNYKINEWIYVILKNHILDGKEKEESK